MTTPRDSRRLRRDLRRLGLSSAAISAAWPAWWSESAESSIAARTDLAFSLARTLGLDPRSLIAGDNPSFLWTTGARFKHLSGESQLERAGLTSFGRSLATALIAATPGEAVSLVGAQALDLRASMLRDRPFVALADLLLLSWAVRLPVVHLRVFPLPHKRMAAMTVGARGRFTVMLGKDARYPAPVAFYLAHEIGHIVNGDAAGDRLVIDLETDEAPLAADDEEERGADVFALELLTGRREVRVEGVAAHWSSGRELARVATSVATDLRIEPGTLAQLYGHSTGRWQIVSRAMSHIYGDVLPVWKIVNEVARSELELDELPADSAEFLEKVLGREAEPGVV